MRITIRRREFITLLGGAAAAWPMTAYSQKPALLVVGFVSSGGAEPPPSFTTAFRRGLGDSGYVEGQNVMAEYHSPADDRLPALMADLVRRRVDVIVALGITSANAAKAATTTIPIVFAHGDDPAKLGLVASLARPGANVTGMNFFAQEVVAKRLGLLCQFVTKAVRVGVLVNPAQAEMAQNTLRDLREAARVIGVEIDVLNASTSREIDAAFATLPRERPDALFVAADAVFANRRVQLVSLAARERIPAAYGNREFVEVGGLMSYGTNIADSLRQVGVYTGRILKGSRPADLPVMQSTKFELIVNLQTARLIGLDVPPSLLAITDEVIE